jgi:hypothetical protein
MTFDVKATLHGNSVYYQVDADSVKEALVKALAEADQVFEFKQGDDHAKVSVKMAKPEKGE